MEQIKIKLAWGRQAFLSQSGRRDLWVRPSERMFAIFEEDLRAAIRKNILSLWPRGSHFCQPSTGLANYLLRRSHLKERRNTTAHTPANQGSISGEEGAFRPRAFSFLFWPHSWLLSLRRAQVLRQEVTPEIAVQQTQLGPSYILSEGCPSSVAVQVW